MYQRAEQWDHSPVTRERMLEINNLTQAYFEDQFRSQSGCWGRGYLTERFGIDLAGHLDVRPGQAPAGWSNLVQHLRRRGVTDQEMLVVGVATTTRTGRLIDRFRDRVMFPIIRPASNGGEILGFVGRRHPDLTDTDHFTGQHSGRGDRSTSTPPTPRCSTRARNCSAPSTNSARRAASRSSSRAPSTPSPSPSPAPAATWASPRWAPR
jgi:hypothetical protein